MPKFETAKWRLSDALARAFTDAAARRWSDNGLRRAQTKGSELTARAKAEREKPYTSVRELEDRSGFSINLDWFYELATITSAPDTRKQPCFQHGRVVYVALMSRIATMDGQCAIYETGTARGLSTLCMLKALDVADKPGHITTVDVLPNSVPIFWNCSSDEGGKRTRRNLLQNYREMMEGRTTFMVSTSKLISKVFDPTRVHFAYLDGEHTETAVLSECAFLEPRQKTGDVILIDDYSIEGVKSAVDKLSAYEATAIPVHDGYEMAVAIRK